MTVRAAKAIARRELTVQLRDKAGLASSVARSVIWLLIFGGGFGAARFQGLEVGYQEFLFPGVVMMSLLFTSMRSGISVIWDREFGFLKEILVSPASRLTIMAGKVAGSSTIAVIESCVVLVLGPFFGIQHTPVNLATAVVILYLTSFTLVSFGLVIASFMKSFEGFQTIMVFLIMPMFFLSGAIFPLDTLPSWMAPLVRLNPLTYGVDALRGVLIGANQNSIHLNLGVLITVACAAMAVGTRAFKSRE
jgi:ABC-2 type transport system permease protein